MIKLHELKFELLSHPPYLLDLAPIDYWLFADLKKCLPVRNFVRVKRLLVKSILYKNCIEMLERHWNDSVAVDGTYINE